MEKKFPRIMGIINITPDSFSDGGKYETADKAVAAARELISEGADIIDVGGESTRPGASPVGEKDELERVIPIIKKLHEVEPGIIISVDTYKASVAEEAAKVGADIINDISGLRFEPEIADVAAKYRKALIIVHSVSTPVIMQEHAVYHDVFGEVYNFLKEKIKFAKDKGVNTIIGDVGIGFGKTLEQNLELLRRHNEFSALGVPMLLGISRKRFLGDICSIEKPADRDPETALSTALLLDKGIDIIRVHNVKLHSELRDLYYELN